MYVCLVQTKLGAKLITSHVSGRSIKNGAVCVCVCVSLWAHMHGNFAHVHAQNAHEHKLVWHMVRAATTTLLVFFLLILRGCHYNYLYIYQRKRSFRQIGCLCIAVRWKCVNAGHFHETTTLTRK